MFGAPGPLVYGTITVAALLATESARHETYLETVGAVAVVMVLYWLAHSYATLMGRRIEGHERLQLRTIGQTAGRELPILTGAMVPLLAVLISWAAGARLTVAVSIGIWISVAMLLLIEVVAGISARLSAVALVIQTVFGAMLGLLIIAIELIFH